MTTRSYATRLLDRCINTFCDFDVMHVSCLNTIDFFQPQPQPGVYCRVLSRQDISKIRKTQGFDISHQFMIDFSRFGFLGVGVFVNRKLAGVSFYTSGEVVARHNRGGKRCHGIGVYLPPGSSYMFKSFVLPSHHGHSLLSNMVGFAINELKASGITTLVTTTSWVDTLTARSLRRQGFRACALGAEVVFLGKHYFRVPLPFNPSTFQQLDGNEAVGTAVRFRSHALT